MSGKVGEDFYCTCCDAKFAKQPDFESHCKSKKHKVNERLHGEQEAAANSICVRGLKGISRMEQFLASYFCQFGLLAKVTTMSPSIGRVQFVEQTCVEKVLKAGLTHSYSGKKFFVSQFKYKPQYGDAARVALQDEIRKDKVRRVELHAHVSHILDEVNLVDAQMHLLTDRLQLTRKDMQDRIKLVRELEDVFSKSYPECVVYQFGSSINGFGTQGCDLDLFLNLNEPQKNSNKQIKDLAKILTSRHIYGDVQAVPSQRCPIVKFTHKPTGIKCDLSVDNRKALYNSRLLRLYSSLPFIRHLMFTLRLWAKFRGLSGGVTGSGPCLLTSYALAMLALFYLVRRKLVPAVSELESVVPGIGAEIVDECHCLVIPEEAQLPNPSHPISSAEILKGFFKFCSENLDWECDALLMRDARTVPRATLAQHFNYLNCRIGAMTVVDPFNHSHNVTANVNLQFRERFLEELKRGAQLASQWNQKDSKGLTELFELAEIPNQNSSKKKDKKSPKDSPGENNKAEAQPATSTPVATKAKPWGRMEGEQENGEFHILLPVAEATLEDQDMKETAKEKDLSTEQYWLGMARDFTINVLETVFMAEIYEREQRRKGAENVGTPMELGDEGGGGGEHKETLRKKRSSGDADISSQAVCNEIDGGSGQGSPATPDEMPKKRLCDGVSRLAASAPTTVSVVTTATSFTMNPTLSTAVINTTTTTTTPTTCTTIVSSAVITTNSSTTASTAAVLNSCGSTPLRTQSNSATSPLSDSNNDVTYSNPLDNTEAGLPHQLKQAKTPSTPETFRTMKDAASSHTSADSPSRSLTNSSISNSSDTAASSLTNSTIPSESESNSNSSSAVSSVRSLWCICRQQAWLGRKKLKRQLVLEDHPAASCGSGLLLEREITVRSLKEQQKVAQQAAEKAANKSHTDKAKNENLPSNTESTKATNSAKAKREDVFLEKAKPDEDMKQADTQISIKQPDQQVNTGTKITKPTKSKPGTNHGAASSESKTPEKQVTLVKRPKEVTKEDSHEKPPPNPKVRDESIHPASQIKQSLSGAAAISPVSGISIATPDSSALSTPVFVSSETKAKATSSNSPKGFCLEFSCDLVLIDPTTNSKVETENGEEAAPPHLLIKLKPSQKCHGSFKVFYDLFRSMMLRLNVADLNF